MVGDLHWKYLSYHTFKDTTEVSNYEEETSNSDVKDANCCWHLRSNLYPSSHKGTIQGGDWFCLGHAPALSRIDTTSVYAKNTCLFCGNCDFYYAIATRRLAIYHVYRPTFKLFSKIYLKYEFCVNLGYIVMLRARMFRSLIIRTAWDKGTKHSCA